jgi:S1-C subfamily serine protease
VGRNVISGFVGGVVAIVIGAILIATNVIDVDNSDNPAPRQAPLASPGPSSAKGEQGALTVHDIYKKVGPGVAYIQAEVVQQSSNPFGFPEQQQGEATGSGFVLNDQGYVATNAHVVHGARNVQVRFGQGKTVSAKIVGSDLSTDLAVIKVNPSAVKLTPVPLGDSGKVQVGDPVVAIGNPLGFANTVTTGIVSALGRNIQAPNDFTIAHAIQTDAAINPGNSGGPLLDGDGRVIGINSQIATSGGSKGNVGIGFAIPVNLAKTVIPSLIKSGKVAHAYMGVTTTSVTPQIAKALKLPQSDGALVQDVQPGSPAAKAGIMAGTRQIQGGLVAGGDLIVGVDGRPVHTPDDITAAIADNKPGDRVQVELYRGTSKRTVTLTLGNRPNKAP